MTPREVETGVEEPALKLANRLVKEYLLLRLKNIAQKRLNEDSDGGSWHLESAVAFVSKLDAAMQATLTNIARTGQPYPATVAAAWRLAMDSEKADGGAVLSRSQSS